MVAIAWHSWAYTRMEWLRIYFNENEKEPLLGSSLYCQLKHLCIWC